MTRQGILATIAAVMILILGVGCARTPVTVTPTPSAQGNITVQLTPGPGSVKGTPGASPGWTSVDVKAEGFGLSIPPQWAQLPMDPATLGASVDAMTKVNPKLAENVRAQAQSLLANGVKFFAFDTSASESDSGYTSNITIIKQAVGDMTLDDYIALNVAQVETMAGVLKPVTHQRINLLLGETEEVRYRMASKNQAGMPATVSVLQYAFIKSGIACVITCTTSSDKADEYRPLFEEVANSFHPL